MALVEWGWAMLHSAETTYSPYIRWLFQPGPIRVHKAVLEDFHVTAIIEIVITSFGKSTLDW